MVYDRGTNELAFGCSSCIMNAWDTELTVTIRMEGIMVEGTVARIDGVAFVVLRVNASREFVYVVRQAWDGIGELDKFNKGWVSPAAFDKKA